MVPGATSWHCVVQGNLLALLHMRVKGTGYQALGPRMAVLTDTYSVRFPDVVVSFARNGKEHDNDRAINDPEIIVELHAAGFARTNLATNLKNIGVWRAWRRC